MTGASRYVRSRVLKGDIMKKVIVREWKDLTQKEKDEATARGTAVEVEINLETLSFEFDRGDITEAEYYKELGCSKHYAEITSWFVPSCYYDGHKDEIDEIVKDILESAVYDDFGQIINIRGRA